MSVKDEDKKEGSVPKQEVVLGFGLEETQSLMGLLDLAARQGVVKAAPAVAHFAQKFESAWETYQKQNPPPG